MNFKVGQRVVCVDDSPGPIPGYLPSLRPWDGYLKRGAIYTVRWVGMHAPVLSGQRHPQLLCVKLEEIVRSIKDPPYRATRFRPVVERKTEIAIFTRILDNVRHRAPAKVE